MVHEVTKPFQVKYPGGKDKLWRAMCSCQNYTSSFYANPELAVKAVDTHAQAKNETR